VKSWLSAAEIAALALPGMPVTESGVWRAAKRGCWSGRPRAGNGGGVEYALDILPAEARVAYVGRHLDGIEVPASITRDADAEPDADTLNGAATEARDARLAVLAAAGRFAAEANVGSKRADRHFCDLYNAGTVTIANWIRAKVKAVTPRTLARWRSHQRSGRTAKLAVDRAASRRNSGVLDRANGGEVKTYILALLAKQPQLTAHHVRDLVADRFPSLTIGARALPLPPVRTFQYALKAWRHLYRNELKRAHDPDGYKSTVRFAARVARPADRLNQLWQIDASPADVLTTDGRYSIYICEDIFSRRLVGIVSKTARSSAVGLTLRKAILAWGVPESIRTDNGSDFVSRETERLLAALGIEHITARPFAPEQKGHVERAIGTMQRDLMRTLPGFVGHSVAERKVIEGRKSFARRLGQDAGDAFEVALSAVELQQRLDDWCADIYGRRAHGGLGNRSPFEVAASASGAIQRVDIRALDMLLMPVAGTRIVTKSGLRIDGAYYIGALDVGAEVMVRMDPADLGRVCVYDCDGNTFLGEAVCPDLAGIEPAAFIAAKRAEQKRREDVALAPLRKVRIHAADIAPAIHRQALKNAGALVEFPKRSEAHETPAIAAARAAADGGDLAAVHSAEVVALHAQLLSEAASPAVIPLRTEETEHQLWNRAREMEAALERGEHVPADDLLWLGGFRLGPVYRGFAETYGVPLRAQNEQRPAFEAGR
jgi:transposase InsO family protein